MGKDSEALKTVLVNATKDLGITSMSICISEHFRSAVKSDGFAVATNEVCRVDINDGDILNDSIYDKITDTIASHVHSDKYGYVEIGLYKDEKAVSVVEVGVKSYNNSNLKDLKSKVVKMLFEVAKSNVSEKVIRFFKNKKVGKHNIFSYVDDYMITVYSVYN